jgi:cell fate (sporulation/competence/biofilm development) regulator YmcA (YheA/YmcA/DUF963 family)
LPLCAFAGNFPGFSPRGKARKEKSAVFAESLFLKWLVINKGKIIKATEKDVQAIRTAIKSHPSVVEVVELLTMHLAPKQILVNAHVNLKNELTNEQIVNTIREIEKNINEAVPKVDMIFLETASQQNSTVKEVMPQHIG